MLTQFTQTVSYINSKLYGTQLMCCIQQLHTFDFYFLPAWAQKDWKEKLFLLCYMLAKYNIGDNAIIVW